jgi:hypothetical protein
MQTVRYRRVLVPVVVLLLAGLSAWAEPQKSSAPPPPAIDPKADALLRDMSAALARAKGFSFESHSLADQVLPSGQKVQFARNQKVTVRRPDRFRATVNGDQENLELVYDGKQVTLLNATQNRYAIADAKPTIDDTLDLLAEEYGMVIPLADLLFADAYKTLTERVRTGEDLGPGYVFATKCRHLAFRQEGVDWQIWIDETSKLPRKLVMTYKEQPGHPQYTAFLNGWNLSAEVRDEQFKFTPPAGATKTQFEAPAPSTQPAGNGK